jgi:sporulation protein YlmC with PRC-barrel domain
MEYRPIGAVSDCILKNGATRKVASAWLWVHDGMWRAHADDQKCVRQLEQPGEWSVLSSRFFYQGETHMFAKFMTAGLVGSALLATVAFAQSPAAPSDRANPAPAAASDSSFQGTWRVSKMVGLSVYNDNNESIGSINDMLTEKDGKIKAVVIGVGGFLGVGEHLVAIPYEKVKFVSEPVAYTGASANRPATSATTGAANTNTAPSANTAPSTAPMAKANPWYPDHAVFNATKDELKAMPEFKYST